MPATENGTTYARWTDKTPHIVVSKTLDKVAWERSCIVRGIEEIGKLNQQAGKKIYVVGGATLVGSLMNAGPIDEVQLMFCPLVFGGGNALFKDVEERCALKFVREVVEIRQDESYLRH